MQLTIRPSQTRSPQRQLTDRQLLLQLRLWKRPPQHPLLLRTVQLHPLLTPGLRRLPHLLLHPLMAWEVVNRPPQEVELLHRLQRRSLLLRRLRPLIRLWLRFRPRSRH